MRSLVYLLALISLPLAGAGQFTLIGSAEQLGGDCIQITPSLNAQQGAAWNNVQLDVSQPFCIHLTVNLGTNDGGADGIAFVLHQLGTNQPTTSTGGNMGYGNFNAPSGTFTDPTFDPSIVIEFDTWNNDNFGDPTYDHVALQRDGTNNHNSPDCLAGPLEASATSLNIEDGQDHVVHIEWNPSTQSLRMEFDDVERFNATVDLENDVFAGDNMVWWGFTGSTGGASNNQSFCVLDVSNSSGIPGLVLDPPSPYSTCPNAPLEITGTAPGLNVSWAGLNSAVLMALPGDHIIEAEDGGCPLTETIAVEGLPAPNLNTTPEITICDGAAATLSASADTGSILDWDGTGGATLEVNSGGTYTVSAVLATCTEVQVVTVIDQASPTLVLDQPNDVALCDGTTLTLTANTDIPASIQWTSNGAVTAGPSITVETTSSHLVEAEAGGCAGTPEWVMVEVWPLPEASIQSFPAELCFGETGWVSAVPSSGSTVDSWILPSGTANLNQAGPGAYTANLISDNGCQNTAFLVLEELPPIAYDLQGPSGACNGESVILSVVGNFQTASWSTGSSGNSLSLSAADGEGPFEVTVALGACEASTSATVEWWPVPSVGQLADTVIRCVLDPAVEWTWTEQASPAVGYWVWSVNGSVTTNQHAWEQEGTYTVRVLDSMTGCADSANVTVDVWPNLDVDAAPYAGIVCWGETTEILTELRAVEGTDIDELPYTLEWNDPEVEGLNPTVGAGTYLLEAENACGKDIAFVEVTQEYCGCDMWMPTAFTPDNDGINDGLKVETNCPELDEFSLELYDRWGQLVWRTDDPDQVWMGQAETLNSERLHFVQDGIYSYRLYWKYSETGIPNIQERRGHLHLLR